MEDVPTQFHDILLADYG